MVRSVTEQPTPLHPLRFNVFNDKIDKPVPVYPLRKIVYASQVMDSTIRTAKWHPYDQQLISINKTVGDTLTAKWLVHNPTISDVAVDAFLSINPASGSGVQPSQRVFSARILSGRDVPVQVSLLLNDVIASAAPGDARIVLHDTGAVLSDQPFGIVVQAPVTESGYRTLRQIDTTPPLYRIQQRLSLRSGSFALQPWALVVSVFENPQWLQYADTVVHGPLFDHWGYNLITPQGGQFVVMESFLTPILSSCGPGLVSQGCVNP